MSKWLKAKRKLLVVIAITVLLVLFIASFVGGYWLKWGWTGFPAKTEWDWLNLLGVLAIPVVVGFGAVWYTSRQTRAREAASERQHKTELEIANENQREAALQTYIDKMSELLLKKDLRQSTENDEARKIARVRTLTLLQRLDLERKGSVLQFLHEAGLIEKDTSVIDLRGASLNGADLSHADLSHADLNKADLSHADLNGADLNGADLSYANLSHANLSEANLNGADLSHTKLYFADLSRADLGMANLLGANLHITDLRGANLTGTKVTDEQLSKAQSLKGATMPDGSKHP